MLHTKLRSAAVVVGLIVLGIIAALILYFFQVFNRSDHFLPGVTIAGIEVSGQSEAEASVAVERSLNNAYNTKIAFYKDDYTYSTTLGFICQTVDVNATVGEFMKQERRRDWKRKILNMDGANEVSYPINIQYNRDRLREIAGEWVGYLQVEPQDARLEMDSRKGLVVVPGQVGRIIDQKATFKQLPQRWQDVSNDLNIAI
ncbi:MAG TPA: hypothetical protein DD811_10945, partial [Syntrophomonas sp.]|nr:hypothetical protein [Syntrophomonas sp.]